jgi:hypothetical protein
MTCLHTNSPGHILTTLYNVSRHRDFSVRDAQIETLLEKRILINHQQQQREGQNISVEF